MTRRATSPAQATMDGFEMHVVEMSDDLRYRYLLDSKIGGRGKGSCLFIMLNPSIADAMIDDPTIRRCKRFTRDWGYARLVVCNLFAFRATDPKVMMSEPEPVGAENDAIIERKARAAKRVVLA